MAKSIDQLSMAGQINYKAMAEGLEVYNSVMEMCKDPMKYQEDFLMNILSKNKDTEYGKLHGFEDIKTIEDFQKKVALSNYDDFSEYIDRMTKNNEENLITSEHITHYNKTSGTVGAPKKIPCSQKAIEDNDRYTSAYNYGMIGRELGLDCLDSRRWIMTEAASHMSYLPNGASFGALSTKILTQMKPYLGYINTSPVEATLPDDNTDTRHLHMLFALLEEDLSLILCTYPTAAANNFIYLEKNWKSILNDMEKGEIGPSVRMNDDVRESVNAQLKPNPQRAEKLREIFSQGFDKPFGTKVWPQLKTFYGGSRRTLCSSSRKAYGPLYRMGCACGTFRSYCF